MTAEAYVLASSETVILLAQDLGDGTSHVTVWTRGKEERVVCAGARICAQHAAGQWSRVDERPFAEGGIPRPWIEAWAFCEGLVPELSEVGMRSLGNYLVIGDPKQRVEAARARAKRAKERKRTGKREENAEGRSKDVGPLGLGGLRWV